MPKRTPEGAVRRTRAVLLGDADGCLALVQGVLPTIYLLGGPWDLVTTYNWDYIPTYNWGNSI